MLSGRLRGGSRFTMSRALSTSSHPVSGHWSSFPGPERLQNIYGFRRCAIAFFGKFDHTVETRRGEDSVKVSSSSHSRPSFNGGSARGPSPVESFFLGGSLVCPRPRPPESPGSRSVGPLLLRRSVHLYRCVYCEILALEMECCYQILAGSSMNPFESCNFLSG